MSEQVTSLDQKTFIRLERLFLTTLGSIAICLLTGFLIVNSYLRDQKSDAGILNVAGKQRMLSQKISKELLQLQDHSPKAAITRELKMSVKEWDSAHHILLKYFEGNSFSDQNLLNQLDQTFKTLHKTVNTILLQLEPETSILELQSQIRPFLEIEPQFLDQMDRVVKHYELESTEKVKNLQTLQLILLILGFILLLITFILVLRPAAKHSSRIIKELLTAEYKAKQTAHNADKLRLEKEQSVNQLMALNLVMEQSLLFARIDTEGYVVSAGSKFSGYFNYSPGGTYRKFAEVIAKLPKDQQYINTIIDTHKNTGWQGEVKGSNSQGETSWFEISINPYQPANQPPALLVICFDITVRKNAQSKINQLTQEHFELEMKQQKELSSKIIENQEQEQNRIAKDIHDGIGQMLTGLKYNIESINSDNPEKTAEKVEQLKSLTAEIINGVRTATFNLSPPELTDYGIAASINKLSQELSKFTSKDIQTINKTSFNSRLDTLVEINIYRIVQEAVNNAIKYAESSQILISISHSKDMLSIVVDDNGKGFDPDHIVPNSEDQGGMGLTFMRERIKYINGRLFISSSEKAGTRITLNIPL